MTRQLAIILGAGIPLNKEYGAFPGVSRSKDEEIENQRTIRHAHYFGRAPSLAAKTATCLLSRLARPVGRIGVLCNGGPWNLQPSWNFIERGRNAGREFLNPLQFPPTLVSATATTAAAAIGAHAFAYVVGHDRLAFFDVLARAAQAIRNDLADHVLAIALSTGGPAIRRAAAGIGWPEPLDVALGFALEKPNIQTGLCLLDAGTYPSSLGSPANEVAYEASIDEDHLSFSLTMPFSNDEFLGATGAVLCTAAAIHHDALPADERGKDFVVNCRQGRRSAFAAFRFTSPSKSPTDRWGPQVAFVAEKPLT